MLILYAVNTMGQSTSARQTYHARKKHRKPVFCRDWLREVVTSAGTTIKTGPPVVSLVVLPHAVDTPLTISYCVCTATDEMRLKCNLSDEESVISPVVEYATNNNYRFRSPVTITMQLSLPPTFSHEHVRVYHFSKDRYKRVRLKQFGKDKHFHNFWGRVQCTVDGNINITTNHLTGFFCTYRWNQEESVQRTNLYLYGKLEESDNKTTVSIRMEAFMNQIQQDHPTRQAAKYSLLDCAELPLPPRFRNRDPSVVHLGAYMELSAYDEHVWMHSQRRSGYLVYPSFNTICLDRLLPDKHGTSLLPQRFDWQLISRDGQRHMSDAQCVIDVGYVSPLQPAQIIADALDYLPSTERVTFSVTLPGRLRRAPEDTNRREFTETRNEICDDTSQTYRKVVHDDDDDFSGDAGGHGSHHRIGSSRSHVSRQSSISVNFRTVKGPVSVSLNELNKNSMDTATEWINTNERTNNFSPMYNDVYPTRNVRRDSRRPASVPDHLARDFI